MPARRTGVAMMDFRQRIRRWHRNALAVSVGWALTALVPGVFGDPPALAQAYGLREKNANQYLGYAGMKWDRDFAVLDGRCNRQAVGAALGAAATLAARGGRSEARQVATIVGSITGAGAGATGGRDLDEKDRACLAQTLELAGIERNVAWTNGETGATFSVVPLEGYSDNGRSCREFVTRISTAGREDVKRHKACSAGDGVWRIAG